MSRTRKAVFGSAFAYVQYALALITGFVLFPIIVWRIGPYDFGLWLMSGELVGYLLLGDLGVFAVLPWLIAAKHGARDTVAIGRYLTDALAIGVVMGSGFLAVAVAVALVDPASIGIDPSDWLKLRLPLVLLLALTGVGFPFRVFMAVLTGLQDVVFGGILSVMATVLTIGLTAGLVLSNWGLLALALAAGIPPVVAGMCSAGRVVVSHRAQIDRWGLPTWSGCRNLLAQGFGAWLGGLGVRLLTASTGLVFAALGRPDLATVYAATAKTAVAAQPVCWIVPDSGLVGLSQVHGEGDLARTRQTALCLLLLYLLIPGGATLVLLVLNPWFVRAWVGANLYAGDYVSGLIAVNLFVATVAGGLFKVVGVVGYRTPIGLAAVVAGLVSIGLGYALGSGRGAAGVAEAGLITSVAVILPFGMMMLAKVYAVSMSTFLAECLVPWVLRAAPLLAAAAWLGTRLANASFLSVALATLGLCGAYLFAVRPLVDRAPWPSGVLSWLVRARLARPRFAAEKP